MTKSKRCLATSVATAGWLLATGATHAAHLEFFEAASGRVNEGYEIFCSALGFTPGNCDPGNDGIDILASPLFAQLGDYSDDDGNSTTQNGQLFDVAGDPLGFVNANLLPGDSAFAAGTTTTLATPSSNFLFSSSARYILISSSASNGAGLFVNLYGEALTYRFSGLSDSLVSYTEFGDVAAVPIPAGWALLSAALAGLALARRRQRS